LSIHILISALSHGHQLEGDELLDATLDPQAIDRIIQDALDRRARLENEAAEELAANN